MSVRKFTITVSAIVLLALTLSGCGSSSLTQGSAGSPETPNATPISVVDLLVGAEKATRGLQSYHFSIAVSSTTNVDLPELLVDPPEVLSEGDVQDTNNLRMIMTMPAREAWLQALADRHTDTLPGPTLTPSINVFVLIDSDIYLSYDGNVYLWSPVNMPLFAEGNPYQVIDFSKIPRDITLIGNETIDGSPTTHISFTFQGDGPLGPLLKGSIQALQHIKIDSVKTDMWIDQATFYVHRLRGILSVSSEGEGLKDLPDELLLLTLSKYNEPPSPPIGRPTNIYGQPSPQP